MTSMLFLYGWANGLAMVPFLDGALKSRAVEMLAQPQGRSLAELQDFLEVRTGRVPPDGLIRVVQQAMALHGWLAPTAPDGHVHGATPAGRLVFDLARAHPDVLDRACQFLRLAPQLHGALHDGRACTPQLVEALERMLPLFGRHWTIPNVGDAHQRRARSHLVGHLNGAVICPSIVALGMPGFSSESGAEVAPSVLDILNARGGSAQVAELAERFPSPVLAPLLGLAEAAQFLTLGQGIATLTASGRALVLEAANFGVVVSYIQLLVAASDALFAGGDLRPAHGVDSFVDRAMNVWGSGRSTVLSGMRDRIGPMVLAPLFDTLPLELQPAGIADMGAGSGKPLLDMASYVLRRTRRGERATSAPLLVIGADPSPVSRSRMASTLQALHGMDGVEYFVLEGDVSDPARYAEAIERLPTRHPVRGDALKADDFLHSQMFLLHDRELQVGQERNSTLTEWSPLNSRLTADISPREGRWGSDAALQSALAQFDTPYAIDGALVASSLVAHDLLALMRRWRPLLARFGLVLVEPHLPSAIAAEEPYPDDETSIMRIEIDASPVIWAAHALSNQFLVRIEAQRSIFGLAGYLPFNEHATGNQGVSLGWWTPAEAHYTDVSVFEAANAEYA